MIQCEMTFGPMEEAVLKKLALRDPRYLKRKRRFLIVLAVMFGLCLLAAIYQWVTGDPGYAVGMLIYLILLTLISLVIARVRLNGSYRHMDPRLRYGVRRYTFEEDGVTVASEMNCGKNYWNSFRYWGTIDHYLYLLLLSNTCILVDQNKLSAEELLELKTLLGTHIPTVEQYSHTPKTKGAKP